MTDLPNCPHCGGPPEVYPNADGSTNYVYCSTCGTRVPGRKWNSYAQIEIEEARRWARIMYYEYESEIDRNIENTYYYEGRIWRIKTERDEARAIARRYYHLYRLEREQHQEFVSWLIDNDVPCP